MARTLPIVDDSPSFAYRIALDGDEYAVSFTWRPRLEAWYLSLFDVDREPIFRNRRLSTGQIIDLEVTTPTRPPGYFLVRGPTDYSREDLGGDLVVIYLEDDEIEPFGPDDDLEVLR